MNYGLDISHMCMVTHQVTKKPVFVSADYMHVHNFFWLKELNVVRNTYKLRHLYYLALAWK